MRCKPDYAKLTPAQEKKVKDLEKDLGLIVLAFEKPPKYAALSAGALKRTEEVEKELGIKLVAYE